MDLSKREAESIIFINSFTLDYMPTNPKRDSIFSGYWTYTNFSLTKGVCAWIENSISIYEHSHEMILLLLFPEDLVGRNILSIHIIRNYIMKRR